MTSADRPSGTDSDVETDVDSAAPADVATDVEDVDTAADAAADEQADPADAEDAPDVAEKRVSRLPVIALSVSVALVVAAAVVAGWFGVAWFQAANDDSLGFSTTRDEVDRVARSAITTMNTLDYRTLDAGLENWADATTGPLHDEIANLAPDKKKQLTDAKPVTSAKVTSSAVKDLDDRGGKATVIAAIEKSVQTGNGKPQTSYQRIQATLTRTKDGWKLENLGPVPYAQPQ
jgi:Mce-associated membrane protein